MQVLSLILCFIFLVGTQLASYYFPPLISDETKAIGFMIFIGISGVYMMVSHRGASKTTNS